VGFITHTVLDSSLALLPARGDAAREADGVRAAGASTSGSQRRALAAGDPVASVREVPGSKPQEMLEALRG
jgi:hypothetical protein